MRPRLSAKPSKSLTHTLPHMAGEIADPVLNLAGELNLVGVHRRSAPAPIRRERLSPPYRPRDVPSSHEEWRGPPDPLTAPPAAPRWRAVFPTFRLGGSPRSSRPSSPQCSGR